jgi:NADPH-dependent 2,4-dienoyl-CoA reductase/sulfur reductase-like enzyme
MLNHLIIGGSDAGISAALRIKEIAPTHRVRMLLKDQYPNYSICGIPFYLSGEISDWKTLSHRTLREIESLGIEVLTDQEVLEISPEEKWIRTQSAEYRYDKLLIATGANSVIPKIEGLNLPGVFTLRWIDEMLSIEQYIRDHNAKEVIIVGGGYIGIEMSDAFQKRGLKVTLIETSDTVLRTLDNEFGKKVEQTLESKGVKVAHNVRISRIAIGNNKLIVAGSNDFTGQSDLVIVATGVTPNTELLKSAGIAIGKSGAYQVTRKMESNLADIYVAGDCGETWNGIIQDYAYMPLGTTAHKQGRIAGENMAGGDRLYDGSIGTQVVKIFDLVAGRTGFHDRDCSKYNIPSLTVESEHWDHKVYYPEAQKLYIRLTANPSTGKLLGMQILGPTTTEVAKRIDIAATAIQNNYTVEQLMDLDLSYTPPLSSPWDPVQMAGQAWLKTQATKANRKIKN